MRIGTWNLEGKWSPEHHELLLNEGCHVWLLTEVPVKASILGMQAHRTAELMGPRKSWAAIFSTADATPAPDPHRGTATAHIDGLRFMSSILPWRSCGTAWPGSNLTDKMQTTLNALRVHIDAATVWGGDWNQALEGTEQVGTHGGRDQIVQLLHASRLSVPTRSLGSALVGQRSIDHIAVPIAWDVAAAYRIAAEADGRRLSDHDAYVIAIEH